MAAETTAKPSERHRPLIVTYRTISIHVSEERGTVCDVDSCSCSISSNIPPSSYLYA